VLVDDELDVIWVTCRIKKKKNNNRNTWYRKN